MSVHEKLAARLRSTPACLRDGNTASSTTVYGPWQDAADALADAIESGDFDDILGVREPTIEDVKREAVRVSGRDDVIVKDWGFSVVVRVIDVSEIGNVPDSVSMPLCIEAPTIAATYAALRTMPDYEGEK